STHPSLVPFPPRRSSDLASIACLRCRQPELALLSGSPMTSDDRRPLPPHTPFRSSTRWRSSGRWTLGGRRNGGAQDHFPTAFPRSEEHTSELQSRFDLVC